MNLTQQERAHYEWQKMTYYSFVGEFVSEVSRMEGFMMETLSLHFTKTRKGSDEIFQFLVGGISLQIISQTYTAIISQFYKSFFDKHEAIIKYIPKLVDARNFYCHAHIDQDQTFIAKLNTNHLRIRDVKRNENQKQYIKTRSLNDFKERLREVSEVNYIINEQRKLIKRSLK